LSMTRIMAPVFARSLRSLSGRSGANRTLAVGRFARYARSLSVLGSTTQYYQCMTTAPQARRSSILP